MSKFIKPTGVGSVFTPLFTLSLSATLLMIGVGMIVALLPQKVFAATGSLESVGLVASAFAFAYLLAQLPGGIFADRFGVKRFLVAGYIDRFCRKVLRGFSIALNLPYVCQKNLQAGHTEYEH